MAPFTRRHELPEYKWVGAASDRVTLSGGLLVAFKNWRWSVVTVVLCISVVAAPSIAARVADFARNAGKVDRLDANEIVRASSAILSGHKSDFHSAGFANLQRTRVTAPVKGILMVWAGLSVGWDDDSSPGSYASLVGRITVDRRRASAPQRVEISRDTAAGTQHMSLSAAVPVTAGPHKVALQLRTSAGEARSYIHPRHIETLFVPFGTNGVQGAIP